MALAAIVISSCLVGVSPAKALTFNFSFFDVLTGGSVINASGILDTAPAGPNYLITSISGTYNSNNITSLYGVNGFQGNDNILHTSGPLLSLAGFSFAVGAASINVYYDAAGQFITAGNYGSYNNNNVDTIIRFSVTETPLPAALPLFATGLGLMGLLGWRRQRKQAAVTA
jgi:hypothetical protein